MDQTQLSEFAASSWSMVMGRRGLQSATKLEMDGMWNLLVHRSSNGRAHTLKGLGLSVKISTGVAQNAQGDSSYSG